MKAFSEAFADLKGTLSKEVQLQISEALEEIKERRDGQDNISGRLSTLESEIEVLKKTILELQTKLEEMQIKLKENKVLELQTQFETLSTNNATFGEQEQIQDSVWRANSFLWFWNKLKA